jgi:hypothetical protein
MNARFQHTGRMEDLEEAITHQGHQNPHQLDRDLEQAITYLRNALPLIIPIDPRPSATSLTRFSLPTDGLPGGQDRCI